MCLREVDPSAETEVPGLAPSAPTLRPADILTRATVRTGEMAVDVMVTSPHALHSGSNAQQEGLRRKVTKYRDIQAELLGQGIVYQPLVWSSYGAPHPEVTRALKTAAERVHRHPRAGDPSHALKRWQAAISVEIWRRAGRMAQRCLRPLVDPEHLEQHHRDVREEEDLVEYGGDEAEEDVTVER